MWHFLYSSFFSLQSLIKLELSNNLLFTKSCFIESCNIGEKETWIRTASTAGHSATAKFQSTAAAEFPTIAAELSAASYSKPTATATKFNSSGEIIVPGEFLERFWKTLH